jgi:hypothetical protein
LTNQRARCRRFNLCRRERTSTASPGQISNGNLVRSVSWSLIAELKRTGRLWWLSTARAMGRDEIAAIWKRFTKLQRERALPHSTLTFKTRGGRHSHIIFAGIRAVAEKTKAAAFGGSITVDPVTDPRTPQAGYRRHSLGGRLTGSHRLEGGGDRKARVAGALQIQRRHQYILPIVNRETFPSITVSVDAPACAVAILA